jgi:DNA-binding MarR family transcriptional regulator
LAAGPSKAAGSEPAFDLGAQTATFVDTFDRWARRKAIDAGASIPRLRLLYSVHCHGPRKMADLADELTVTPRNVTALVDGLEADGLVRRVPHATDRRVTMVELTCSSDRVASQFAAYQASVEGLFAGLDDADLETFRRLIATLGDRMHADAAGWANPDKDPRND